MTSISKAATIWEVLKDTAQASPDRHRDLFLGPHRAERLDPCYSAYTRNMPFTCHNDPMVTPIDPLLSIWSAANRITSSGKVLGKNQCVPVLEAIRSVTTHAAFQAFAENHFSLN